MTWSRVRVGGEREGARGASGCRFIIVIGAQWSLRVRDACCFYAQNDCELLINGVWRMEDTSAFADFILDYLVFR